MFFLNVIFNLGEDYRVKCTLNKYKSINLGVLFRDLTVIGEKTKAKMNKWDYNKLRGFIKWKKQEPKQKSS